MPPILQIQVQRAPGDCTITALSMYLGKPYEDVLGAAVAATKDGRVHHNGMLTRQMKRTAKALGFDLTLRRSVDLEHDDGLLSVKKEVASADKEFGEHIVYLKAGLIFDTDGTVWEPEVFLQHYRYRPLSLLVREEV